MSKKLANNILIAVGIVVLIAVVALVYFRWQGRQRTPELTVPMADIAELRFRVNDTVFKLYRLDDVWMLSHPAYAAPVAADEVAVETLLDNLRHWEVRGIATAEVLDSIVKDTDNHAQGRLRIYTRGRFGGLHPVWRGRWRKADRTLYLKDGHRLYSRLYDPRQTDGGGEAALAADFTADARHWRNRWICHYYYYDVARAEWRDADGRHYVYTAEAAQPQPAQNQTAALSAFRGVYFDRYAEAADSAALRDALSHPAAARFSVVSTAGDRTQLEAYTLYDTAGRADWFRLCGILEKRPAEGDTPRAAASRDTVFLSYQLLDRLRAALGTIGETRSNETSTGI